VIPRQKNVSLIIISRAISNCQHFFYILSQFQSSAGSGFGYSGRVTTIFRKKLALLPVFMLFLLQRSWKINIPAVIPMVRFCLARFFHVKAVSKLQFLEQLLTPEKIAWEANACLIKNWQFSPGACFKTSRVLGQAHLTKLFHPCYFIKRI
jgi:hypothetical protein